MTKTEIYSKVIALVKGEATLTDEDKSAIVERMEKDIESTAKKSGTSKAKENKDMTALVEKISDILAESENPMSIPEIMKALGDYQCADGKTLTSQRISAVLTNMCEGTEKKEGLHLVTRTEVKKVAYFAWIKE